MRSVPPHWKLCKLGDVIRLKNGYAFKSNDYTEDGIPLIRISDINDNKVTIDSAVRIPREEANADFYIESGDLLIAMSGATTGKTGVYNGRSPILQNQRVGNFKIIDENVLDKRYRNYYVASLRKDIEKAAYGGAQPNISSKGIESFDFPLAPIKEQKLIVSEIEKQFSRLDEAVAALKRVRAGLKRYKASVLKAAVEGKLTEEWRKQNPDVEPADKLLERIKKERSLRGAERRSKLKGKEDIASLLARKDNLPELPKGWVWATVDHLYDIIGGGTPSTKISEYWDGRIPWITSADIYGVKDIRPRKQITKKAIKNSATNLVPKGSLIVVTRVGLGKIALTNTPLCFSQDSQALVDNNSLLFPSYSLYYLFNAVQRFKYEHRGTTIAGVTKKQLADLEFAIPPLPEQKKIVEDIESRLSIAEEIEETIDTNLKRAERLRQAILKKAFSGRLVPQEALKLSGNS